MKTIFIFIALISLLNISKSQAEYHADNCLDGQNLNAADVDIANCPAIPSTPEVAYLGSTGESVNLGAWELGQTAESDTYKYGTLSSPYSSPRYLHYYNESKSSQVDELNLICWAKGYYRLRKILQNPPANYLILRNAGFQVRFFQFQTDLRNGSIGFRRISSYMDHLVKWVTLIEKDDTCVQPTLKNFSDYVDAELIRRSL